jgi:hypothetical protein
MGKVDNQINDSAHKSAMFICSCQAITSRRQIDINRCNIHSNFSYR